MGAWSFVEPYLDESAASVVDAVLTAADGLGTSPVAVALAWVRDRPGVVAPVVGARSAAQLQGSLASEDLVLPPEIRQALGVLDMVFLAEPGVLEARQRLALRMRAARAA